MGLGDSVAALLDTYSKCLELLRSLKPKDGAREVDDSRGDRSQLRKSIKSDRGKIHRTYSSRLSESGSRFEKGDDRSRSALRRILKKLKATLANLLNFGRGHEAVNNLDYRSLMTLSNSSRADAVRAMDQFSQRLGSASSKRSSSSTSGSSSSRSSSKKNKKSHSRSSSTSSSASSKAQHSKASAAAPKAKLKSVKTLKRASETTPKTKVSSSKGHQSTPSHQNHDIPHEARRASSSRDTHHRISILSIATDSTKLGEIPERKWRRRLEFDTSSEEYNVRTVYPLKPYHQPEPKRRTFFGLFKR